MTMGSGEDVEVGQMSSVFAKGRGSSLQVLYFTSRWGIGIHFIVMASRTLFQISGERDSNSSEVNETLGDLSHRIKTSLAT
jgi:hypothetical protein